MFKINSKLARFYENEFKYEQKFEYSKLTNEELLKEIHTMYRCYKALRKVHGDILLEHEFIKRTNTLLRKNNCRKYCPLGEEHLAKLSNKDKKVLMPILENLKNDTKEWCRK